MGIFRKFPCVFCLVQGGEDAFSGSNFSWLASMPHNYYHFSLQRFVGN